MVRNYCQFHSDMTNSWIPPLVNSKDGVKFAMLFPLRESRKNSDSALLRVRSKELRLHPQTPWLWIPPAFATLGLTSHIKIHIPSHSLLIQSTIPFFLTKPIKLSQRLPITIIINGLGSLNWKIPKSLAIKISMTIFVRKRTIFVIQQIVLV